MKVDYLNIVYLCSKKCSIKLSICTVIHESIDFFIIYFQMWDLQPEFATKLRNQIQLPRINFDAVMIIILVLIILKLGVDQYLAKKFAILVPRPDQQLNNLQYSPFYHVAIVILILNDVNWNMFDVAIWILVYVGVGIIRRAILAIKNQRESLLNGYSYDLKLMKILDGAKNIGIVLFIMGFSLFFVLEVQLAQFNLKIVNLLVYPLMMLAIDSLFLFLCCAASANDILCYYNQNINEIQPTYKLDLCEKIVGNSVRVWHFYNLIRIFFKSLFNKMGILDYMWIFSILNACFKALKSLVNSISKFRSYSKLMNKFDRLFRRSTSAPDQTCTICLTELLNCRQLGSCGHLFHYRCLFQWMQTKMQCPICRAPIQFN